MDSNSVLSLLVNWKEEKDKEEKIFSKAKNLLTDWIDREEFYKFTLDTDVHFGLLPVAIGGRAHDWSVLYHEEQEKMQLLAIELTANKDSVDIVCEYEQSTIYATIPLGVLASYEFFHAWAEEQLKNYTSNLYYIEQRVKSREEGLKEEKFKKWLEEGKKFEETGLVSITPHGELYEKRNPLP